MRRRCAVRIAASWLTDGELRELAAAFGKLLQPYLELPATPDRTRLVIRTIVLPCDEPRAQARR